jgi:hypothetical protein
MKVRRVVAGNDAGGKSVFLSDDVVPNFHDFEYLPGQAHARIWFAPGNPAITPPRQEPTDNTGPMLPEPGGTSFLVVQYAPDSVAADPRFDGPGAGAEFAAFAPDLAQTMDPDEPGMHRTASIDYGIVLDGEIWLELDGGQQARLSRGDTIVQLGGRHAWRNKSGRPATLAFVLTGARE